MCTLRRRKYLLLRKGTKESQATLCLSDYSSEIAPVGHVPAQEPQEMHESASISNLPSPSEIAPTGQEPAQAPHATQLSPITNAMIISSFNWYTL